MVAVRSFRKGSDEEAYVRIFNSAFIDYDDMRAVTVDEVKILEEAPSFNLDGLLIAESYGQPVGMVSADIDKFRQEKKGFIQRLAVLPEFRHQGIARLLLSEALRVLKNSGMQTAQAWVQTGRAECIHLVESLGFETVRTTSLMKANLLEPQRSAVNEEVQVRLAKSNEKKDLILVTELMNEAFKEHFGYRPMTVDETEYMLRKSPWYGEQTAWIAIQNNLPLGYIVAGTDKELNREKNAKHGWINDIAVLKPFRRQKIGTRLLQTAMQHLRNIGMQDALLYVDDQNVTGAKKLYEAIGFKLFHTYVAYELQLI